MELRVGDNVVKNPETWQASEFDAWGAGEGTGEIVAVEGDTVDVQWDGGRCFQDASELTKVDA